MKTRLLGIIALAALSTGSGALAADLRVKAPVYKAPPPVVAYSWTGFYVGGNIGYSWGRSSNDWNFFAPSIAGVTVCTPAGAALCATGSDSNKLNGAIGGFQAGYNWQTAGFVVGVETDFQFSGQKGDQLFTTVSAVFANGVPPGTVSTAYTEKLAWLGTLRGRAGFAADRWLVYATGGLAYGRVTVNGSATATGSSIIPTPGVPVPGSAACVGPFFGPGNFFGTCPVAGFSNGVTKAGWTIGVGAEGAITDRWSWKVEYLHVDLGKVSTTFATLPGCYGNGNPGVGSCILVGAGAGTISSRITDEILRVGINYRFGPGPVIASY